MISPIKSQLYMKRVMRIIFVKLLNGTISFISYVPYSFLLFSLSQTSPATKIIVTQVSVQFGSINTSNFTY